MLCYAMFNVFITNVLLLGKGIIRSAVQNFYKMKNPAKLSLVDQVSPIALLLRHFFVLEDMR
jgi:hypothetical protein